MRNCNLLNRIEPQAGHSPRLFANGSAGSLGTKLENGHESTMKQPVIAAETAYLWLLAAKRGRVSFCFSALNGGVGSKQISGKTAEILASREASTRAHIRSDLQPRSNKA
jgi:hypothetical protein